MFGVCQIDSKVTESQATFTFSVPQDSRSIIFDKTAGTWSSVAGDHRADWDPGSGIAFKFLLERPYDDLQRIFAAAEETIGEGLLRSSFPFSGIVMMALNNSGEYWMDLALKWMAHPEFVFTSDILTRISELAFQKTPNQKLKHRFLKLYARLKKEGLISETAART